jgi:hypothetical protein
LGRKRWNFLIERAETNLRPFSGFLFLATVAFSTPSGFAQKIVDPNSVAPEYREAAERRRAEQIRQIDCSRKADAEKIMPRERTNFLIHCLEISAAK